MPRATARATAALGLTGLWMALLFAGWAAGGLTHLLLLAALVLWPWSALAPRGEPSASDPPADGAARAKEAPRGQS